MADEIKKIKIKDLPQTTSIGDDDIFVESDTIETYKVTADDIAKYVSENEHITNTYVTSGSKGVANGVAPLNLNKKIDGKYITYGTTPNTAYEGSSGKILETNLDNHLTDENAHGYNSKINAEIERATNAESNLDNKKANLASPTFTGTPKAPTASAGTNTTQIATTAFVNTTVNNKISDLIGGAPETMDTLKEVSDAIAEHQEVTDALNSAIGNKVDKVEGKGLSTNDLTDALKTNYDVAYTHSQATHARTDATKVEKSSTNGNIKINGTETTVYTHPSGTNPHGTTKSDVGLGNVGDFKAVSIVANQGLTDTEKSNARTNIGAGTSSFSGSYNDLTNKPTIPSGAAASKGVDTSISDASTSTNLPTSKAVASFVEGKGYKTTDNNTTYSLSKSGNTITLTGSDGSTTSVTDSSGSSGSSVSFTRNLTSGTKVGTLTIDGTNTDLYAPTDTNTTYSAGTGLSLSGTTFNHKNSVTAGTAQGDASKTLTFGGTFTIPTVSYDAQGHVTSKGTTTMTMPANPNSDTKVTQTVTTSDASYPLLLAPSGQTATATTTSYFDSGVTLNPSTNTIAANVSGSSGSCTGNAATATALGSSAGSATQPVYFSSGKPVACTYTLGKSVPSNAVFTDNDTKNTAGSTDSSSKLFLIGATSQAANPQTYSQDTAYVGADGCLYSNSTRVVSEVVSSTEPTNQKNGDYWLQDY